MKYEYYVGQNILYRENGSIFSNSYHRVYWFDKIASIVGNNIVTEAGLKLRISELGFLKFKGRMPKHNMVNLLDGKENPTNLGANLGNRPIYDFSIIDFISEKDVENYKKAVLTEWSKDLASQKEALAKNQTQKERKDLALKELIELRKKNDEIKEKMWEEEFQLEQALITKHCKNISKGPSGCLYCELW